MAPKWRMILWCVSTCRRVPAIVEEDLNPEDLGTLTFNDFLLLSKKLSSRELTGNAAKDAIADAATKCHGPTWNYFFRRVLRKDLQCGVTDTIINKVLKKLSKNGSDPEAEALIIPIFECQLAKPSEQHLKKLVGKKFLDIKLDGVRLLTEINKENRTVMQFSRDGKPLENFTAITKALEPLIDLMPESMILDGEVVAENFQQLMTQVNREKNVNTDNAKLALFDIIPLRDFKKGLCPTTQRQRHLILSELQTSGMLTTLTEGRVFVVPKVEVDFDTEEGIKAFNDFNKQAIELKYEGIMIKDPEAPYTCKRSDAWLKKKPKISVSLEICGFKQGEPDGKYADMLGSILGRGFDEGRQIETYVGGFTDEQRAKFWTMQDELMGMIMEVEGDAFTKNRDSDEVWSLRFPVFKGLRGRTKGEKL